MATVTIRLARPEEYDQIGAVTVDAYVNDGFLQPESPYVAELTDARSRAAATLLVAVTSDGEVLGTVTFCRYSEPFAELARPGEAEFRMLAVAKRARGNGIGGALTQACVELAQGSGDHGIVLSSQPSMRAAHRIYERLGFVRAPDRDWEPVPGVKLLAYYRSLGT